MSGLIHCIAPQTILDAYRLGLFPMGQTRDDPTVYWVQPTWRGILPFDRFHVPRSLAKTWRRGGFQIRIDNDFRSVIRACADDRRINKDSWINDTILETFTEMHLLGYAHSVECWRDCDLIGGLYGLAIGGAFFGESMFSRAPDASKLALIDLVARLRFSGFCLLDTQFVNTHLQRFGATEVPKATFSRMLEDALKINPVFYRGALPEGAVSGFVHVRSHTS
ncbi:MAG: leucyl/phenylalanyl-tRNA--protein transferase [Holosporales bacterium]|jgi:leucyl/phenylalanyl-tRNA--protein transferase